MEVRQFFYRSSFLESTLSPASHHAAGLSKTRKEKPFPYPRCAYVFQLPPVEDADCKQGVPELFEKAQN